MKKFLLSIVALVSCAMAQATDTVTASDVTIEPGGTATVNIVLNCEGSTYKGFQLDLVTPVSDGITPTLNSASRPVSSRGSRITDTEAYTISSSMTSSGLARFVCTSLSATPIAAGNDVLIKLSITANEEAVLGPYTGHITNIEFNTVNNVRTLFDDIEFTITVVGVGQKRIEFNENDAVLPDYTSGAKGNVSMVRTINAGKWSTIVLPFTLTKDQAVDIFGTDVQLAEFSGFEVDYGDDEDNVVPLGLTIKFTPYTMSAKKPLSGGKPFLIKTSKNITSFVADDVPLFNTVTDVSKTDEWNTDGKFTGSLVRTLIPLDGLFISNNQFWYSEGNQPVNAFRGWFELAAVLDKETTDFSVKMLILVDGEETAIEDLVPATTKGSVYDLSGRKVQEPNKRGVYIVNGKKVYVK